MLEQGGLVSMLHYLTAIQLAKKVRDREVGCVELLEHFLDRCRRYNDSINAIIVWNTEAARIRAEAADVALAKGEIWGPLHGVPMTIKESYDVCGLPTTWGVPEYKTHVAQTNAVVVDRMLKAGVVLFGKTNVPLLLGDWQTFNEIYGTTSNPWDLERVPGGSSGGSAAALSAGLTGIESGSDIGGSIRNPAHYCGVYGHKPTWGVVPVRGQALPGDLADTDLAVVGPLARGADDLAVALKCMAGSDDLESDGWKLDLVKPIKRRLSEFRVAVMLSDDNCPVDGEYGDQVQHVVDVMAKNGVIVSDRARPDIDLARSHGVYLQLLRAVTTAIQPLDCFEENRRKSAALKPGASTTTCRYARLPPTGPRVPRRGPAANLQPRVPSPSGGPFRRSPEACRSTTGGSLRALLVDFKGPVRRPRYLNPRHTTKITAAVSTILERLNPNITNVLPHTF